MLASFEYVSLLRHNLGPLPHFKYSRHMGLLEIVSRVKLGLPAYHVMGHDLYLDRFTTELKVKSG